MVRSPNESCGRQLRPRVLPGSEDVIGALVTVLEASLGGGVRTIAMIRRFDETDVMKAKHELSFGCSVSMGQVFLHHEVEHVRRDVNEEPSGEC